MRRPRAQAAAALATPVRCRPTSISTSRSARTPAAASAAAIGSAASYESTATVRSVEPATPARRRHASAPKIG